MYVKIKNPKRFAAWAAVALLLTAYLIWTFPVNLSNYVGGGKTSRIGITYLANKADGTSTSNHYFSTQDAKEIDKVVSLVGNYQYHKKLIQSNSVKSYSVDTILIEMTFYGTNTATRCYLASAEGNVKEVNIGIDSHKKDAYGVGLWGSKDEQSLFQNLASLVSSIPTNSNWE